MRYAVISDIHGNLEAFRAVLSTLSKDKIDRYLCVGDVVGYGADPSTCIRLLKEIDPEVLIAGNHEWGIAGLLDLEYFNEYARQAVIWTKSILRQDEVAYLGSFKLLYEGDKFTMVHGSLDAPAKFGYIIDDDDAYSTMQKMKTSLCFVGHSHAAGIFYSEEGDIKYAARGPIKIDEKERYVVNAGSVGQPRDGDPRASYVIYDTDKNTIEIRRVQYDIKIAQQKILDAGLPERLAFRLSEGR